MSVYDRVIEDICPKCGEKVFSEGIRNGIGYYHPPFHCECGWSEMRSYKDKMEKKLREIIAKHYSEILSELEELIDTDEIALIIEVSNNEFNCKLG